MKRIVEVTCSLKDANEVIEELVKDEGKDTKDLLVTIPVEIDDSRATYEALVNNPKIVQWDFYPATDENAEQENSRPDTLLTDNIPREDIGRAITILRPVDLYKFIYLLCDIYVEKPALLPLTKTWETKYYSKLSDLSLTLSEDLLNKCQVILDLMTGDTIDRAGEIGKMVYDKLKGYSKNGDYSADDPDAYVYCRRIITELLEDKRHG